MSLSNAFYNNHKSKLQSCLEFILNKVDVSKPGMREVVNGLSVQTVLQKASAVDLANIRKTCSCDDFVGLFETLTKIVEGILMEPPVKGGSIPSISPLSLKSNTAEYLRQIRTNNPVVNSLREDFEDTHEIAPASKSNQMPARPNSFQSTYPNLPSVPCPHHYYVYTLRPKYLNGLYDMDPSSYPADWEQLKTNPIQAWNSLNERMISYTNEKFGTQGLSIAKSDTTVGLSSSDLQKTITKTIERCFENKSAPTVPSWVHTMESLVARLSDIIAMFQSLMVKMTGRDMIYNPTSATLQDPSPSSVQGTATLATNSTPERTSLQHGLDQ